MQSSHSQSTSVPKQSKERSLKSLRSLASSVRTFIAMIGEGGNLKAQSVRGDLRKVNWAYPPSYTKSKNNGPSPSSPLPFVS